MIIAPADTTNPKDLVGVTKPDLSLVPPVAVMEEARALEDGADKYGPFNWRDKKVRARVYIAAAKRHMDMWLDGEDTSRDTRFVRLKASEQILGSWGLVKGDVVRAVDETDYESDGSPAPNGIYVYVKSGLPNDKELLLLDPSQYETVKEPVHHLGHARACLAIIIDAESVGALVDDRPLPGATGRLIRKYTQKS